MNITNEGCKKLLPLSYRNTWATKSQYILKKEVVEILKNRRFSNRLYDKR